MKKLSIPVKNKADAPATVPTTTDLGPPDEAKEEQEKEQEEEQPVSDKGAVKVTHIRATKDTLYDAYSKSYFFTNRATRVDLPLNNWIVCQIEAGLLVECDENFGPEEM